jgi:RNA polymerase sigma-70 factor (ECF subfamily)
MGAHIANGEGDAVNRLTLRSVQAALERLPDEQRLAVLLVCVEELSYAEAAEVLAVPVGTIMSRLARGRLALRRLVEGQRGDPETIQSQGQVNMR